VIRRRAIVALVLLLAIVILLRGSALLGRALGNLGMIVFLDTLLSETTSLDSGLQAGVYPLLEVVSRNSIESQIAMLQRAAALDPNSTAIRWGLARMMPETESIPKCMLN